MRKSQFSVLLAVVFFSAAKASAEPVIICITPNDCREIVDPCDYNPFVCSMRDRIIGNVVGSPVGQLLPQVHASKNSESGSESSPVLFSYFTADFSRCMGTCTLLTSVRVRPGFPLADVFLTGFDMVNDRTISIGAMSVGVRTVSCVPATGDLVLELRLVLADNDAGATAVEPGLPYTFVYFAGRVGFAVFQSTELSELKSTHAAVACTGSTSCSAPLPQLPAGNLRAIKKFDIRSANGPNVYIQSSCPNPPCTPIGVDYFYPDRLGASLSAGGLDCSVGFLQPSYFVGWNQMTCDVEFSQLVTTSIAHSLSPYLIQHSGADSFVSGESKSLPTGTYAAGNALTGFHLESQQSQRFFDRLAAGFFTHSASSSALNFTAEGALKDSEEPGTVSYQLSGNTMRLR